MSASGSAPRVAVFGAGAFGGWTALELARRGARVTLVDAWGPGNARASSGGETRAIRATYGSHAVYTDLACRALERWEAAEREWQRRFLHRTGVLWLFAADDGFGRASAETLRARGVPFEPLTRAEAARRYPQIDLDGVRSLFFEPAAGYLLARRACEHVAERVTAHGGVCRLAAARTPVDVDEVRARGVRLADGERLEADHYVFACGPWLGALFPEAVGAALAVTRQDVFYFGTPAGDTRFADASLPVWIDVADRVRYGMPGNAHRGFKVADDTPGPPFDPSAGERAIDGHGLAAARAFLGRRFPALAAAPLVGAEVCQYESTPDAHFILDRHPAADRVWLAGGGSGHGFKMGPAVGEMLALAVLGAREIDPAFALARLSAPPPGGWREKWS